LLVFAGDLPRRDDPLPRFLDDGAAAKLLQGHPRPPRPVHPPRGGVPGPHRAAQGRVLRSDHRLRGADRLGLLAARAGRQAAHRPIHPAAPQLKDLLDDWVAHRPTGLREPYLFIERGRRITTARVDRALANVAREAGIGHVTPHQLRHTLATQAINRGMSLEAIAALLGHRSMRMTMVYARIANRTVAEEYFAVSEKVEALYDAPKELPADAEGAEMRRLRAEMHRRMLGNGYCARPVGLDCHFESICESCTFFQTTIEFRPTLQAQRDDAVDT
jgi:hypothetical protein